MPAREANGVTFSLVHQRVGRKAQLYRSIRYNLSSYRVYVFQTFSTYLDNREGFLVSNFFIRLSSPRTFFLSKSCFGEAHFEFLLRTLLPNFISDSRGGFLSRIANSLPHQSWGNCQHIVLAAGFSSGFASYLYPTGYTLVR